MTALEASLARRGFRVCTTALLPSCEAPGWLPGREVDVSGVRALPLPSGSNYDRRHIDLSTVGGRVVPEMWERFHFEAPTSRLRYLGTNW
ncbi:hypothetical protein Pve01_80160 [Planomonospora venezuelensis]|nr:hypothetical protein Pve01_80160 [Planomonospora venezuelensis]